MTQLNINSIKAILQEELNQDRDFLKEIIKNIIQQLMEEERDIQVGRCIISPKGQYKEKSQSERLQVSVFEYPSRQPVTGQTPDKGLFLPYSII